MIDLYLVCEGPLDAQVVAVLVDRLCVERFGCEAHQLHGHRQFIAVNEAHDFDHPGPPEKQMTFSKWSGAGRLPEGPLHGRRAEGHRVKVARRVLWRATDHNRRSAVVVLLSDHDHAGSLAAAGPALRANYQKAVIAIGVPVPEVEIWLLHAFDQIDADSRSRWQLIRRDLGEDPCALPADRVLAGRQRDGGGQLVKWNAKNIADRAFPDDRWSRLSAAMTVALKLLRARGAKSGSGLVAFLDDVDQHLVPALDPKRSAP